MVFQTSAVLDESHSGCKAKAFPKFASMRGSTASVFNLVPQPERTGALAKGGP
jgi:hypothetical protein